MNVNGKEIERKFLISYPTPQVLAECSSESDIVQTYLKRTAVGVSNRVRARTTNGICVYTHTEKQHITDVTRIELEHEIGEEEYNELLKQKDPERNVIIKKRYCLNYLGQEFEIDVYPFWSDRAVMELELSSEEQEIFFPECVHVIRELTEDKRYTNASLAKSIPEESI